VTWRTLESAPPEVVSRLPAEAAIRLGAVPYASDRGSLRVAFQDPSNLAALDEAAAILRKRVVPGIVLEVHLFRAHRKFYGRRIPPEFRAVVEKLQRGSSPAPPAPRSRTNLDFRAPDLLAFERRASPSNASPPPGTRRASTERPARRIPVSARAGLPPPPDLYGPEPVEPGAATASDFGASAQKQTAAAARGRAEETSPLRPAPLAGPAPQPRLEESLVGEVESLSEWVGDALGRFQAMGLAGELRAGAVPEIRRIPSLRPRADQGAEKPRTSAIAPAASVSAAPVSRPGREVSGMWRSSLLAEEENGAVSGMWTGLPAEDSGLEAASREELARAAVETYLADFPRVLFLESGKSGIAAWRGRGEGLPQRVTELRIATYERSAFRLVLRSGTPHFGPLERELWPRSFAKILGPVPPDCAIFPIRVGEEVAAFLYADRLGEPLADRDFGALAQTAVWAGKALSRILSIPARSVAAPSSE